MEEKFANLMNLKASGDVFLHFVSQLEVLYMSLPELRKLSHELWQTS